MDLRPFCTHPPEWIVGHLPPGPRPWRTYATGDPPTTRPGLKPLKPRAVQLSSRLCLIWPAPRAGSTETPRGVGAMPRGAGVLRAIVPGRGAAGGWRAGAADCAVRCPGKPLPSPCQRCGRQLSHCRRAPGCALAVPGPGVMMGVCPRARRGRRPRLASSNAGPTPRRLSADASGAMRAVCERYVGRSGLRPPGFQASRRSWPVAATAGRPGGGAWSGLEPPAARCFRCNSGPSLFLTDATHA